jgi:hypothetical protein
MIYPGFVYRSPGSKLRGSKTYEIAHVLNQDEFDAKISAGWSETVIQAIEKAGDSANQKKRAKFRKPKGWKKPRKPSKPIDGINHRLIVKETPVAAPEPVIDHVADDAPPTRQELEAKAEEIGLKFDGRTSDRVLLQRIQEAIEVK